MMENSLTEKLETTIVKFKEELEMAIKDFGKLEGSKLALVKNLSLWRNLIQKTRHSRNQ